MPALQSHADSEDAVSNVQFSTTAPELLVAVGSRDGPACARNTGSSESASSDASDDGSDEESMTASIRERGDGYLRIVSFTGVWSCKTRAVPKPSFPASGLEMPFYTYYVAL
jgi:hypothetical protein